MVPLIERLGTPQVRPDEGWPAEQRAWQTDRSPPHALSSLSANRNRSRGRPADQGEALLRPVYVRGHPDAGARLPGGRHLARAAAQQRCHARGRVRGVPPPMERHAVCVLHPSGSPRVHRGVSPAAALTHVHPLHPLRFETESFAADVLQAVLWRRPPLGRLHDHCPAWPAEALRHPGLQLPPAQGAEARRQGRDHKERGEFTVSGNYECYTPVASAEFYEQSVYGAA